MLIVETIENISDLEYYLSVYKDTNTETIIGAEYNDIVNTLIDNGRKKWYAIKYCGKISKMSQELSLIKNLNFPKFFLHISMSNPLLIDLNKVLEEFISVNESEDPDGEMHISTDNTLCEDEVDILVIAPEYELGWKFRWLMEART